jgi:hypothetical protein
MEWIDPKNKLPPQGKKILYFKYGDIYVVQRFADLWVPVPFHDSEYAFHDEPELWCDITPPHGLTGKIHLWPEESKRMLDVDEIEAFYPDLYQDFIDAQRQVWVKDGVD